MLWPPGPSSFDKSCKAESCEYFTFTFPASGGCLELWTLSVQFINDLPKKPPKVSWCLETAFGWGPCVTLPPFYFSEIGSFPPPIYWTARHTREVHWLSFPVLQSCPAVFFCLVLLYLHNVWLFVQPLDSLFTASFFAKQQFPVIPPWSNFMEIICLEMRTASGGCGSARTRCWARLACLCP